MSWHQITRRQFIAGTAAVTLTPYLLGSLSSCHSDLSSDVTNALEHRTYDALKGWVNWLSANGAMGYFGETSVPNSLEGRAPEDVEKWLILLDKVYRWFDRHGVWATGFTASRMSNPREYRHYGPTCNDIPVGQRTIGVAYEQASVVEAHASGAGGMRGMNANGGEVSTHGGFSNKNPGTFGVDYYYPDIDDFRYLRGRGHYLARIAFRWERVQPTINQALSTTELARLKSCVADCAAAGMKAILDVHNYAGYIFSDGYFKIGSDRLPISAFADLWRRLSSDFKGTAAVLGYDLMNEPHGLPGGVHQWENASQAATNAIRSTGDMKTVFVPGYHKASTGNGVFAFIKNHSRAWISGPSVIYTTHGYWDKGLGTTYDEDNAYWFLRGYNGGLRSH